MIQQDHQRDATRTYRSDATRTVPPPGCHPLDSTILAFHRSPASTEKPSTKVTTRTKSLFGRSNITKPQQQRGRSAGPSKSATYLIFTQNDSTSSTSSLINSSSFNLSPRVPDALLHASNQAPFADPLQAEHPLPPSTMMISHNYLRRENNDHPVPPVTIPHMPPLPKCANKSVNRTLRQQQKRRLLLTLPKPAVSMIFMPTKKLDSLF
jgi:hypothetical protein